MKQHAACLNPAEMILILVIAGGPGTRASSSHDIEWDVKTLTLTVSRIERDTFGNPVHPFNFFTAYEADPGTMLLAKVTPREPVTWKVQADHCWIASFRDDLGTDLSTNAAPASEDHFFPRNRPLEVLTARDNSGAFGLRIRSQRFPAPGATRLIADVVLLCRLDAQEQSQELRDVLLQTNQAVTVGPLRVKFLERGIRPSASGTNPPATQKPAPYWLAAFQPQSNAAVASVTFFSSKSDEPILAVRNIMPDGMAGSANAHFAETLPKSKETNSPFFRSVSYGFSAPSDGKVAIKVRYYDAKSLVERHCLVSADLSLSVKEAADRK